MTFDPERLQNQIPYYLTAKPDQDALVRNLKDLMNGAAKGYYIHSAKAPDENALLQGDGRQGFQVFSFVSGERRGVRGVVLSNSCDISADNKRAMPPKLVFAPIVKLSGVEKLFRKGDLPEKAIIDKIEAIKRQEVTSMFYLPAGGGLTEDSVINLDDLHSMPAQLCGDTPKLFTLSMAGFYLFAFKLSVHFCRLHENVDRSFA